jgi:hypothetical protein
MQILGSSSPYLQAAISSVFDSVAQGLVETNKQEGNNFLNAAIDTFSFDRPGVQSLFNANAPIAAPAEYPDPVSFLGNQGNGNEMLVALKEPSFQSAKELNGFSTNLTNLISNLQPGAPKQELQTLNLMASTVGNLNNMNQNLDLQVQLANLSGPGTFNPGKVPLPSTNVLIPANPVVDYPSLEAKKHYRLFRIDGADKNDVDVSDIRWLKSPGSGDFMTMVGAVARQNPNRIKNMITENSDGSITVTFKERTSNNPLTYRNRPVTIDSYSLAKLLDPKKEMWPYVIEMAWDRANRDTSQKPLNLMEAITGRPVTEREIGFDSTFAQAKKDFDSGKPMYIVATERNLKTGTTENKNIAVTNVYIDEAGNQMIELRSIDRQPFSIPFYDLDKVQSPPYSYTATNYSTLVTG